MTTPLYLTDSYLKTFEATVVHAEGNYVILDKTAFYPTSGGQPHDTGTITVDDNTYNVMFVKKTSDGISHEVDTESLKKGDAVTCVINWERRYTLMKYHTAMHLLCSVFHKKTQAKITGNQIGIDKSRVDLNLEEMDRTLIENCVTETNALMSKNLDVSIRFMKKEDALKDESLIKLASKELLDKLGPEMRIVSIGDVDTQIDGGTHVTSTSEIGTITLLKIENKGKNNRRIYFTLS